MAFEGYLLKLGSSIFPLSYVFKETYEVTPNRRFDLDSTRNANGELSRNVVSHTASTIAFQTKPMWNEDLSQMMKLIRSNYINETEKKLLITYYSPDLDEYKTGTFYVPDIKYPINYVDVENNRIFYNSFSLEFIEY